MNADTEGDSEVCITFDELRCFDVEDIPTCVSVKSALTICEKSVADLSAKTVEVLSLWLRKLLRGYLNDYECNIQIFKCLYEWLMSLKDDVSPENKEACADFILVLTDAVDFAEWAKVKLLATGERLMHVTVFLLMAIVYSCLEMCNEYHVEALKEHESKAIELHLNVLNMLGNITNSSTRVHPRVTPLLRHMIEIADFLSLNPTHLNAFVKTSKTMTAICAHYNSMEASQDEMKAMPEWMQDTLLHLCDTVLNQLETVNDQSSSVPEEQMKVIHVYLIMIHKLLSTGAKHMDTNVLEGLFLILSGGESKPNPDINPEIQSLKAKYMHPFIMQLYKLLYQHEDFQKYLIACLTESANAKVAYDDICLDYVNACIIDDTELSKLTYKTLYAIFDYFCKDAGNFCNAARYKSILEVFASLVHVTCCAELFNYFCCGVFADDIIRSQMSADVLMLSYRLEEQQCGWTENALTKVTKYWIKCNNSYAIFSQNPSQLHVERMLKYFHNLKKLHEPPAFNLHNYRYISCVFANQIDKHHLWVMKLQRLFQSPLNDIEQYYEILALISLVSTSSKYWLLNLPTGLKELLVKGTYDRLNNVFFKLALNTDSASRLLILETLMPAKSVATSCWYGQRFLHMCQKSGNPKIISLTEQHVPAPELRPLLDMIQPSYSCPKPNTDSPQIIYNNLAYKSRQPHRCTQSNLKRKRSECDSKNILGQLQLNAQQLSSVELDATDLKQLSGVVKTLQDILTKQ
ncbi:PREDICTED: uncharacterized protein LOC108614861 [Drosophila arizonae]|uniref:Uncharacterized protein LOC108614861 n=1 Tax=Drosophila arizonae TaxID=7263 RepID=A0ABM1PBI6_DROAR|nr:PREDICTED: uncharacterized protein LOC108614861 [Drosophila arizonae]